MVMILNFPVILIALSEGDWKILLAFTATSSKPLPFTLAFPLSHSRLVYHTLHFWLPILFCSFESWFFPETANENELELEIAITREGDRHLGSDVTLRLVFVPPPDPLTDNDASPGKNEAMFVSVRHHASVFFLQNTLC